VFWGGVAKREAEGGLYSCGRCTVDRVRHGGARVQGFTIGQLGGGGASRARDRFFGVVPRAGNGWEGALVTAHRVLDPRLASR
jgi:hypothetical protein